MTADPSVTEQVAEVLCRARCKVLWRSVHVGPCDDCRKQADALAAAGLTPQGTTVEEWGVRHHDGWVGGPVPRNQATASAGEYPNRTLVRRTRTTYPDRVSEWQPAPEEER